AQVAQLGEFLRRAIVADAGHHVGDLLLLACRDHVGDRVVLFLLDLLEVAQYALDLDLVVADVLRGRSISASNSEKVK
ncbi:hypothetical protein LCGC14_2677290, partial [marine sediment metagenome]